MDSIVRHVAPARIRATSFGQIEPPSRFRSGARIAASMRRLVPITVGGSHHRRPRSPKPRRNHRQTSTFTRSHREQFCRAPHLATALGTNEAILVRFDPAPRGCKMQANSWRRRDGWCGSHPSASRKGRLVSPVAGLIASVLRIRESSLTSVIRSAESHRATP